MLQKMWNRDFPVYAPPFALPTTMQYRLSPCHDTPAADLVVSVSSEQGLAVGAPGQGDTLGLPALLANLQVLGLQLVNLALLLEVEDDDAGGGGSAQPVAGGGEDEGVDLVTGGERVEVLGLVQVPEHGGSVLTTGGAQGAIGRDGDGVDVSGVTDVVGLDAAGSEFPDLDDVSLETRQKSKTSRLWECKSVLGDNCLIAEALK